MISVRNRKTPDSAFARKFLWLYFDDVVVARKCCDCVYRDEARQNV